MQLLFLQFFINSTHFKIFVHKEIIMSQTPQYVVDAHYNGEILVFDDMGIIFENIDICRFKLSRNAKFEYLRERIQTRM